MIIKKSIKRAFKFIPSPLQSVIRFLLITPLRIYIRFAPWSTGKLFLYNSIAEHLWWLETNVSSLTVFGSTLQVDASDIVGKHIYYFGIWEPKLTYWIQHRLCPGDIFIDIGANIGYYSLLASRLVGNSGKVISIEALPQIFDLLESNLKKNGVCNVRTINTAAWDKQEKVKIFTRQEGATGVTTLMAEWANQWHLQQQLEVDAKPLSVILTTEEIRNARLMKIDVEGAEWHVISEMKSWLSQTREDFEITIEISRRMMQTQGVSLNDILHLFAEFGFQAYQIQNNYLASTYIQNDILCQPHRLYQWPDESMDQIDLVFSRVYANFL
jgi:FkbM family methyltransferase